MTGCNFDKQLQVINHDGDDDITTNIDYANPLQVRRQQSDLTNMDIYETLEGVTAEILEDLEQLYVSHAIVTGFSLKSGHKNKVIII